MPDTWEMSDPGAFETVALYDAVEDVGFRMWRVAGGVRADERVDVFHRRPSLALGMNWPFGMMRAAFFQRMFSRSSPLTPMTSSARDLARAVHIVRSQPHNRRAAPRAFSAS